LRRYYNVCDDLKVIHHGVDIQTFNPQLRLHLRTPERAAASIPDHAILGLYVGDWQKSGKPLLQLLQKQPELWLMAVTGSPHEAIRRAAIEYNVQDRLVLHAPTHRIERTYAAADIFLFPSFYDTFGMVTSEAMACGLPVIVSAAAGVSEWIIDGRNGIILRSPWDADELSAAVARLLATPALRDQFGEQARETVEAHHWDRVAEETMKVYEHVLTRIGS
jgi:UDP-glucose:(heptosyl)LPS alpha-1,3-glucosyltransferase